MGLEDLFEFSCVQLQVDVYFLNSLFCPPCILMKGFPFTATIIISPSQDSISYSPHLTLCYNSSHPGKLVLFDTFMPNFYFSTCLNMSNSNNKDVWEGLKVGFKKWDYYAHKKLMWTASVMKSTMSKACKIQQMWQNHQDLPQQKYLLLKKGKQKQKGKRRRENWIKLKA